MASQAHSYAVKLARPLWQAHQLSIAISDRVCNENEPAGVLAAKIAELLENANNILLELAKASSPSDAS